MEPEKKFTGTIIYYDDWPLHFFHFVLVPHNPRLDGPQRWVFQYSTREKGPHTANHLRVKGNLFSFNQPPHLAPQL